MSTLDFTAATRATATVVAGISDEQLAGATPCPAYSVADLLDHVAGLCLAFTASATKERIEDAAPSADGSNLPSDWRSVIPARLTALSDAWHTTPGAYDGMTQAGPIDLPAPVAAQVALNEVVVHGWDLAVATGRPYDADPAAVAVCTEFVTSFEPPADGPADDGGLFGPPVTPAPDASALDRLVAAAGRHPDWATRFGAPGALR